MHTPVDASSSVLILTPGPHDEGSGLCVLEACARHVGAPHSDHPLVVSPLLAHLARLANDWYPDTKRQELLPLVPRFVKTGPRVDLHYERHETDRRKVLYDYTLRRFLPVALARIGQPAKGKPFVALPTLDLDDDPRDEELLIRAATDTTLKPLWPVFEGIGAARRILAFEEDPELLETAVLRCFDAINLSEAPCPTYVPASLALWDALLALVRPTRTKRGWSAEA